MVRGAQPAVSKTPLIKDFMPASTPSKSKLIFNAARLHPPSPSAANAPFVGKAARQTIIGARIGSPGCRPLGGQIALPPQLAQSA